MDNDLILRFDDYTRSDKPRVGGKNASLGEMIRAGFTVPPGFAVTTEAYETLRGNTHLAPRVRQLLAAADHDSPAAMRETSSKVRAVIESFEIEPRIQAAVRSAYAELCENCDQEDVPVAVRSSATAEDLADASFAGQQDTFLWVSGADNVLNAMRRCWSSIFTDRAIAYRREMDHDHEVIAMSVGVQQMVDPKAAGVAFTLNPSNGDRSQVAIESSFGLGEAVVSGEVTPDSFLVDKVLMTVHRRTISPKHKELVLNELREGVEWRDVEEDRQWQSSLSDAELVEIARMAKAAEQHFGPPQDVEWAIDRNLPDGKSLVLLQSRPETVWSQKPRTPISKNNAGLMDGIVATLLSPMHAKGKTATSTG